MNSSKGSTRRRLLGATAAVSAASLAPPYLRTARAAGSLSVGFWEHWVPGGSDALTRIAHPDHRNALTRAA